MHRGWGTSSRDNGVPPTLGESFPVVPQISAQLAAVWGLLGPGRAAGGCGGREGQRGRPCRQRRWSREERTAAWPGCWQGCRQGCRRGCRRGCWNPWDPGCLSPLLNPTETPQTSSRFPLPCGSGMRDGSTEHQQGAGPALGLGGGFFRGFGALGCPPKPQGSRAGPRSPHPTLGCRSFSLGHPSLPPSS